jgi:hypothetical protein
MEQDKMIIERVKSFNGEEFKLFHILIEDAPYCVAEERLESHIKKCIESNKYHLVESIDERYGYYIPQEIADTNDEEKIKESLCDVLFE